MKDIKILLGKRIKELRKGCNISQQELAEKVNIDQRNLSNIERGISFPSKSLLDIANAFNISLPELFEFEHINISHDDMANYIHSELDSLSNEKLTILYKFIKIIKN